MWGGIKRRFLKVWRAPYVGKPFVIIVAILLANQTHYWISLSVFRSLCGVPPPPPVEWSQVNGGVDITKDKRIRNCSFCAGFLYDDHFDFVDVLFDEEYGHEDILEIVHSDSRFEKRLGYWAVRLSMTSKTDAECVTASLRPSPKIDAVCVSPTTAGPAPKYELIVTKHGSFQPRPYFPMFSKSADTSVIEIESNNTMLSYLAYTNCCTVIGYWINNATIKTWSATGKICTASDSYLDFVGEAERKFRAGVI